MGGCVVETADGELSIRDGGVPDIRLMLAPAADVVIHDTWHVSGLRGTGSQSFSVSDAFVPTAYAIRFTPETRQERGPLCRGAQGVSPHDPNGDTLHPFCRRRPFRTPGGGSTDGW